MKKLLLGNAAAARGLFEAGCTFVSSYPGTPSTEITEEAAKFPEVYAEWAPNEKCALDAALGASIAGARAMCAMTHVGGARPRVHGHGELVPLDVGEHGPIRRLVMGQIPDLVRQLLEHMVYLLCPCGSIVSTFRRGVKDGRSEFKL